MTHPAPDTPASTGTSTGTSAPAPILEPLTKPSDKAAPRRTAKPVATPAPAKDWPHPAEAVATPGKATKLEASKLNKANKVSKPVVAPKVVAKKVAKPAAKTPVKVAKPVAAPSAAVKSFKVKLVRDSFTIPAGEYAVIAALKQRALLAAHPVKKSELLRAGIQLLAGLNDKALMEVLKAVPIIKTGRPKGKNSA